MKNWSDSGKMKNHLNFRIVFNQRKKKRLRTFDHKNYEKEISKKNNSIHTKQPQSRIIKIGKVKNSFHIRKKVYFWHQPAITPKDDDDKIFFPLSITKELQLISMMSELSFSLTRNEGKKKLRMKLLFHWGIS